MKFGSANTSNYLPDNGSQKIPFYKKTWFIILMYIIIPPVGAVMMWGMRKQWNKILKIVLSVIAAFWLLVIIVPSQESPEPTVNDITPSIVDSSNSSAELITNIEDDTTDLIIIEESLTAELSTKTEESTTIAETTVAAESTTKQNSAAQQTTTTKQDVTTTKAQVTTTKKAETTTKSQPTTTKKAETTTKSQPTTTKQSTSNSSNAKMSYVLNTNTMKFHYPGCRDVDKINSSNRMDVTDTRENIINSGYSSCGHCHP